MEEVLGDEGLQNVLEACRQPCNEHKQSWGLFPISPYMTSLEDVYGVQAGRGLALRVGRACFPYGLREYGESLGLMQTSFRLLPFPRKLRTLSEALNSLLHECAGQQLTMEEAGGKVLWHLEGCPICQHRHTSEPACQLTVGLAEEALYWLSGGKMFEIEESACIARGDPRCTLQIDPAPLF